MKWIVIGVCIVSILVFVVDIQRKSTAASFTEGSIKPSLVRDDAARILKTYSSQDAYQRFTAIYDQFDFNIQHTVAHIFGETLFEIVGNEGISYCDSSFSFGCYHGFFTRSVSSEGLTIITALDEGCGTIVGGNQSACRHGIGHGILEYLGTDHLTEALAVCLKTTQPDPVAGCTSGVFMEYNVPLITNDQGEFIASPRSLGSDPYTPCGDVETQFKASCYFELPQWWEQVYNQDVRTIGRLCSQIPEKDYVRQCFVGYGRIVAPSAEYNPKITRSRCEEIESREGSYLCRASAAWSIALNGGGYNDARQVCEESVAGYGFSCPIDAQEKNL